MVVYDVVVDLLSIKYKKTKMKQQNSTLFINLSLRTYPQISDIITNTTSCELAVIVTFAICRVNTTNIFLEISGFV